MKNVLKTLSVAALLAVPSIAGAASITVTPSGVQDILADVIVAPAYTVSPSTDGVRNEIGYDTGVNSPYLWDVTFVDTEATGGTIEFWFKTKGAGHVQLTTTLNPESGLDNPLITLGGSTDAPVPSGSGLATLFQSEWMDVGTEFSVILAWDAVTAPLTDVDFRMTMVPVPASLPLLGGALAGFAALRRRKAAKKA